MNNFKVLQTLDGMKLANEGAAIFKLNLLLQRQIEVTNLVNHVKAMPLPEGLEGTISTIEKINLIAILLSEIKQRSSSTGLAVLVVVTKLQRK